MPVRAKKTPPLRQQGTFSGSDEMGLKLFSYCLALGRVSEGHQRNHIKVLCNPSVPCSFSVSVTPVVRLGLKEMVEFPALLFMVCLSPRCQVWLTQRRGQFRQSQDRVNISFVYGPKISL